MVDKLTGWLFKEMVLQASDYLESRKSEVDSLNVFPVPDGDTGTNMFLTLSRAASKLRTIQDPDIPLSRVTEICAFECLMGARGNSGVILSQIMRGISSALKAADRATAAEVVVALREAVATAYKAVVKPVEGTMLTVLREGTAKAIEKSACTNDIREVLQAFLSGAQETLERTPDMLPVLKQAGVVDAGGKGLCIIMEGALTAFDAAAREAGVRAAPTKKSRAFELTEKEVFDIRFPYDTQFLISGKDLPAQDIRDKLQEYGDSLLVVGSSELLRVHIHTSKPGEVLSLCLKYGMLSQVVIDNMIEQSMELLRDGKTDQEGQPGGRTQAILNESGRTASTSGEFDSSGHLVAEAPRQEKAVEANTNEPLKETGIIAVASGKGLQEIMSSLGADLVIDGGTTMNPSTADLARAVDQVNAKKVIFLPNNANIFLSAKQAKKLTGRRMYVVPSKTVPQGISALMALNLESSMTENLKRASKAVRRVKTGEVTFAARNGKFGRHVFKQGDVIGLCDGKVETVGQSPEDVLYQIISRMRSPGYEVLTVYCGRDISPETEKAIQEELSKRFGDMEIEVSRGDQPLYYYIVSLE
ncbi:MAG TPA: DAK2 domain-containing protein [Firmicutes bacterium]|nr:DAK2 domain-containing protein [Candidatus Fermentithermobacillaceae bacterium]